jgi:hypothetical protein
MVHAWRREFVEKASVVFEDKRKKTAEPEPEQLLATLYQQIGQQVQQLTQERDTERTAKNGKQNASSALKAEKSKAKKLTKEE